MANEEVTTDEMDSIWEDYLRGQPLTEDDLHEIEHSQVDPGLSGRPRRALLVFGTKKGSELLEKARDREVAVMFAMIIAHGEAWLERQKRLSELAEGQLMRLRMSLMEREDMDAVLAEGEALADGDGGQ